MNKDQLYAYCLQGKITEAIVYLRSWAPEEQEAKELLSKYEKRFYGHEPYEIASKDPWIRQVVSCYFDYFKEVLLEKPVKEAEGKLKKALEKVLSSKAKDIDGIEEQLGKIFKEKGYSFMGGRTIPYLGPYIWKTTKKYTFNVELLDNEQTTDVYILSDFLMISWMHFATLGEKYAGGWAKPEGLYYVHNKTESLDMTTDKFQSWFLKHEAQHLSDYKNFPKLNSINLEYRAKLMEIIYSDKPNEAAVRFLVQAKKDKEIPHPYAAYKIIENLSKLIWNQVYITDRQSWQEVPVQVLKEAAIKLFRENTEGLIQLGKEAEGII